MASTSFNRAQFIEKLTSTSKVDFEEKALRLFQYQATHNPIYSAYMASLGKDTKAIQEVTQIPFLPIEFFKSHQVITGTRTTNEKVFESSGTTGKQTSRHYVQALSLYDKVSQAFFEEIYGSVHDYHILALLPSYLERDSSSLVHMVAHFIKQSGEGGFYLHDQQALIDQVALLKKNTTSKILVIGVTFALLDIAQTYQPDWRGVIVMETGGMKGRRKEITREEVHHILKTHLNITQVHSEYGMTELLSQAYAPKEGHFYLPQWTCIYLRDINDPFSLHTQRQSGGINMIDLANIDSCAFIETKDIGRWTANGALEILGRIDNTDIRGCSLLTF
ncbi:MAG: acyl transferase [Thermonemataceae bacterium]